MRTPRMKRGKTWLGMLLGSALALGLSGGLATESEAYFTDTEDHWANDSIVRWADAGVVSGYASGAYGADDPILRRDLALILNQLMGYQQNTNKWFSDLYSDGSIYNQLYVDAIQKLNAAGLMDGAYNMVRPNDPVSREEVAQILYKALFLDISNSTTGSYSAFADEWQISPWASEAIHYMQATGLLKGRLDNMMAPQEPITRAEFATILNTAIEEYYSISGDYTSNTTSKEQTGTIVVNAGSTTIGNKTVYGDLILAEGIAYGSAYLNDMIITGNLIVKGGNVKTIYLNNVDCYGTVVVDRVDAPVRVVVEGNSSFNTLNIDNDCIVDGRNLLAGNSLGTVNIGGTSSSVQLYGTFGRVTNTAYGVDLTLEGTVTSLLMQAGGTVNGSLVPNGTTLSPGDIPALSGVVTTAAANFDAVTTSGATAGVSISNKTEPDSEGYVTVTLNVTNLTNCRLPSSASSAVTVTTEAGTVVSSTVVASSGNTAALSIYTVKFHPGEETHFAVTANLMDGDADDVLDTSLVMKVPSMGSYSIHEYDSSLEGGYGDTVGIMTSSGTETTIEVDSGTEYVIQAGTLQDYFGRIGVNGVLQSELGGTFIPANVMSSTGLTMLTVEVDYVSATGDTYDAGIDFTYTVNGNSASGYGEIVQGYDLTNEDGKIVAVVELASDAMSVSGLSLAFASDISLETQFLSRTISNFTAEGFTLTVEGVEDGETIKVNLNLSAAADNKYEDHVLTLKGFSTSDSKLTGVGYIVAQTNATTTNSVTIDGTEEGEIFIPQGEGATLKIQGVTDYYAVVYIDNKQIGSVATGQYYANTLYYLLNFETEVGADPVTMGDHVIKVDYMIDTDGTHEATLTGGMTQTYTVTFNANGGTGSMAVQTVNSGEETALKTNTFTRTDYKFLGWATTSGGAVQYRDADSVTLSKDLTLYAVWEEDEVVETYYTVTLDSATGVSQNTNYKVSYLDENEDSKVGTVGTSGSSIKAYKQSYVIVYDTTTVSGYTAVVKVDGVEVTLSNGSYSFQATEDVTISVEYVVTTNVSDEAELHLAIELGAKDIFVTSGITLTKDLEILTGVTLGGFEFTVGEDITLTVCEGATLLDVEVYVYGNLVVEGNGENRGIIDGSSESWVVLYDTGSYSLEMLADGEKFSQVKVFGGDDAYLKLEKGTELLLHNTLIGDGENVDLGCNVTVTGDITVMKNTALESYRGAYNVPIYMQMRGGTFDLNGYTVNISSVGESKVTSTLTFEADSILDLSNGESKLKVAAGSTLTLYKDAIVKTGDGAGDSVLATAETTKKGDGTTTIYTSKNSPLD